MTDWDNDMDIWEHQVGPLTAGHLRLGDPEYADVPVLIAIYDGTSGRKLYTPAEIGYVGQGDRPEAVVITVIPTVADSN
jgi:hypothetical protein